MIVPGGRRGDGYCIATRLVGVVGGLGALGTSAAGVVRLGSVCGALIDVLSKAPLLTPLLGSTGAEPYRGILVWRKTPLGGTAAAASTPAR